MRPCSVGAEAAIDAPVAQVWDVVADVLGYQHWSQTFWFTQASLQIGGGALLWVCVQPPLPAVPIPVRFRVIDANRELRWGGGVPGVATGSHYLKLKALPDGRTQLLHGEDFSGLALRAAWPVLGRLLKAPYQRFASEIAAEVAARMC